ncbi:MAG: cupin domain-containing protein, partial [Bacteroidota bacterium]
MRRFLLLSICMSIGMLFASAAFGQNTVVKSAKKLKPTEEFDNIHVQKLFSDAKASCFVIWVKQKVRLHKHAAHSETVYVLGGKGEMTLGKETFQVRKGDVVFIPEGTPHAVTTTGGVLKV